MSESKELVNRKLGEDVVGLVGGKENILSISHCMTRLRFKLRDDAKADTKAIESHKGVIQVINANGQYQVVVGINVIEDVYDAAVAASGVEGLGEVNLDGEPVKKGNVVSALIDTISGVIQPILAVCRGHDQGCFEYSRRPRMDHGDRRLVPDSICGW